MYHQVLASSPFQNPCESPVRALLLHYLRAHILIFFLRWVCASCEPCKGSAFPLPPPCSSVLARLRLRGHCSPSSSLPLCQRETTVAYYLMLGSCWALAVVPESPSPARGSGRVCALGPWRWPFPCPAAVPAIPVASRPLRVSEAARAALSGLLPGPVFLVGIQSKSVERVCKSL